MKRSFRVPLSVILLAALSLACSFSADSGTTPTVIYVPVTTTPEPAQPSPQPSNTAEPLPTLPQQTITAAVTPTSDVLHFYVSGYVWDDLCPEYDGPVPNPIPAGCILDPVDGLTADG
ncbi:MAG: hypothetical protein AB1750_08205, partial [Chloroflexota bacterium]